MYIKSDFKEFINKKEHFDFFIIDPPWKYDDINPRFHNHQLTYNLWENNKADLEYIMNNVNTDYIFLWVTNSMIPEIKLDYDLFELKSIITWVKQTVKGNIVFGLGSNFRNSTEQLLLFKRKDKHIKNLHLPIRNVVMEECGKRTCKPKIFEQLLIDTLAEKKLTGAYLFSGNPTLLTGITCVDIEDL